MIDLKFYKGKKVLITGHTGFKGSWLSRILLLSGAEVYGYSLDAPTIPNLYSLLELEKDMSSTIGDIRDLKKLDTLFQQFQPEIVFHLAAQPIVRASYKEPVYTYETNVMGTVNVLECIRKYDCVKSFLNITTDKVYENMEWEYGYRENDRLDGYDPYSNSKSCSELVTHSYQQSFFKERECAISTVRAGNVIGGGDFASDRIVPDCVRAAEKGCVIQLRNPHSIRPYQHVLEPLAVYLLIAEKQYIERSYQGHYNVGPDDIDCISTGELASIFCQFWGDGLKWINICEEGPHEAAFLKLDCSKLKKTFQWRPRYHVQEAVKKTVEWSKIYFSCGDMIQITDRQIKEFFRQDFCI